VRVEGLSDGTRDQIYLALRLAAIRTPRQNSLSLFDDVLINSDDTRATAALQVIGELARSIQRCELEAAGWELTKDIRYALRQMAQEPGWDQQNGMGRGILHSAERKWLCLRRSPRKRNHRDRRKFPVRTFFTQGGAILASSPVDLRNFAIQNHTFERWLCTIVENNVSFSSGSTHLYRCA
jgi:hypothetical protein